MNLPPSTVTDCPSIVSEGCFSRLSWHLQRESQLHRQRAKQLQRQQLAIANATADLVKILVLQEQVLVLHNVSWLLLLQSIKQLLQLAWWCV